MKVKTKNEQRGLSPLISTLLLVAAAVIGGGVVYAIFAGQTGTITSRVDMQVQSSDVVVTESVTLITASVKNIGTVGLDNCVITVYSENTARAYTMSIGRIEVGETRSGENTSAAFADFRAGKTYAAYLVARAGDQSVTKSWSIITR